MSVRISLQESDSDTWSLLCTSSGGVRWERQPMYLTVWYYISAGGHLFCIYQKGFRNYKSDVPVNYKNINQVQFKFWSWSQPFRLFKAFKISPEKDQTQPQTKGKDIEECNSCVFSFSMATQFLSLNKSSCQELTVALLMPSDTLLVNRKNGCRCSNLNEADM